MDAQIKCEDVGSSSIQPSPSTSVLSPEAIKEFQLLWLQKYGEQLTEEQASEKGLSLISFLRRIGYPLGKQRL